jgi:hypothetical protein
MTAHTQEAAPPAVPPPCPPPGSHLQQQGRSEAFDAVMLLWTRWSRTAKQGHVSVDSCTARQRCVAGGAYTHQAMLIKCSKRQQHSRYSTACSKEGSEFSAARCKEGSGHQPACRWRGTGWTRQLTTAHDNSQQLTTTHDKAAQPSTPVNPCHPTHTQRVRRAVRHVNTPHITFLITPKG